MSKEIKSKVDRAISAMTKALEIEMYGAREAKAKEEAELKVALAKRKKTVFSANDLVVFSPLSSAVEKKCRSLTKGKVYKIKDHYSRDLFGGSLPIENDKYELGWYKGSHFVHHDPAKHIFEQNKPKEEEVDTWFVDELRSL